MGPLSCLVFITNSQNNLNNPKKRLNGNVFRKKILAEEDLHRYEDAWKKYDQFGENFIPTDKLFDLLIDLDKPEGIPSKNKGFFTFFLNQTNIMDHKG